jgi:hypothetical protein
VPNRIITDLGKAFTSSVFLDFGQKTPSTSITPRSPTLGATARSNKPMAWCFKLLKIGSTTTLLTMLPGG